MVSVSLRKQNLLVVQICHLILRFELVFMNEMNCFAKVIVKWTNHRDMSKGMLKSVKVKNFKTKQNKNKVRYYRSINLVVSEMSFTAQTLLVFVLIYLDL